MPSCTVPSNNRHFHCGPISHRSRLPRYFSVGTANLSALFTVSRAPQGGEGSLFLLRCTHLIAPSTEVKCRTKVEKSLQRAVFISKRATGSVYHRGHVSSRHEGTLLLYSSTVSLPTIEKTQNSFYLACASPARSSTSPPSSTCAGNIGEYS